MKTSLPLFPSKTTYSVYTDPNLLTSADLGPGGCGLEEQASREAEERREEVGI
jgi:hypothetical protein